MTEGARANRMTKAERSELLSLIRKREKVMKTAAAERSAAMMAEFEAQAAKIHSFNDDATWAKAKAEAQAAVEAAAREVEARCQQLGIPKEFAPDLAIHWYSRGENAVIQRMAELRRVAKRRIEAIEAEAVGRIERMALEAQTTLIAEGIDTDAARQFLEAASRGMEDFMPSLKYAEVETMMQPRARHRQIISDLH